MNKKTAHSHPPAPHPRPSSPSVDPDHTEPELTAGPDQDPPEPGLDPTLPVNAPQGAPGHQVPDQNAGDDEDEEGRSVTEQLFERGALQAEQDKVNQAPKADR